MTFTHNLVNGVPMSRLCIPNRVSLIHVIQRKAQSCVVIKLAQSFGDGDQVIVINKPVENE